MRSKAHIALLLILLTSLPACSSAVNDAANSVGVSGRNLVSTVLPHPYRFEQKDRQEILDSGRAIVSLYFATDVKTSWRKVLPDGSVSEQIFTLTYSSSTFSGRRESKLEPGTYFLDGVIFSDGKQYYSKGSESEPFSEVAQGWNYPLGEAKCFSFTLEPGQDLFIPNVEVSPNETFPNSVCPRLVQKTGSQSPYYRIGPESGVSD